MTKPYFTIEEMISVPSLSRPTVSDDGNQLAWVEARPDWDKNQYRKHVYLYDAITEKTRAITWGETEGNSPTWSSQGILAWVSTVDEGEDKTSQVFALVDGSPIQLTQCKSGVLSYRWSPDGKGLYYLAPDPKPWQHLKKRRERYGDFEYEDIDDIWSCLYYLDLEEALAIARASQVGPGDLRDKDKPLQPLAGDKNNHILNFDISRDNTKALLCITPSPIREDGIKARLFILDLTTKSLEAIETPLPIDEFGTNLISPNGEEICYTRPINEGKWYNTTTLEIMNLETGATRSPLLELDQCIYPIAWTDRGLVFSWQNKVDWYIGLLQGDKHLPLQQEQGSVTFEAGVSRDGEHFATVTATRTKAFDVYMNGKPITKQGLYYQDKSLSNKEVVSWTSKDGTVIEGVLITPPSLDQEKAYPLLVIVHGGPTWVAFATPTDDRYYPYEQFVEKGFIILDVNYRGSSGYGENFRKLNYRNLGIGDYEDVISGVDMLVERGLADNDKVGIMGWSQGGYISAMCATYSDRFKAISVGAGISSWYTYYNNTDIPNFTRHYLGDTPWVDPEIYARTSPITYIRQACTPTLIQHGDQDVRVPYANARELYRGLKDMGVPVHLVSFKGMGHGATKPGISRAIMQQNMTWFCHYLLGEELDGFWLEVQEEK